MVLELAKNAYRLYEKQSPHQQRKRLNFLLLNSSLKDGKLDYTYRKPFDWVVNPTQNEKWWRKSQKLSEPYKNNRELTGKIPKIRAVIRVNTQFRIFEIAYR